MADELTRDHVVWAYRLLLDRDPESEDAIAPKLRAWRTPRELRTDIMSSAEYRLKNPDPARTAGETLVIKPLARGPRLWIDLADHVIGLAILRDAYEADEVAFALRVLRPGDVALDVGAHIGFFTLHMADAVGPSGAVYAFEPLERNAALLERSIRENGFDARVRLERAAVSNAAGTIDLHFAAETLNTGGAFISAAPVQGLGALSTAPVRTVKLDDCKFAGRVRLLKIDVEGAEPLALAGAERLLKTARPIVIAEIHPEQLARVSNATPASFLEQMAGCGYAAHAIDRGRLGPPLRAADIQGVTTVAMVHAQEGIAEL